MTWHVHTVIVDEWHELMGNKRGVQVQLALARLKRWNPGLIVWGLSATLGNLAEAMHVLLGQESGELVRGRVEKNLVIDTLLPVNPGRFSWGGHLGKQMQLPVVEEIGKSTTTLVFVNVRSQAEIWYQLLLAQRPEWAGVWRCTTARSTRRCVNGSRPWPRGAPRRPGASRSERPRASRSTCWCSTWSRWRSAVASSRAPCSPRCAARMRIAT